MFIDAQPNGRAAIAAWVESLSRYYPRAFYVALVLFMIMLTLGLMLDITSPVVLYQGF